MALVTGYTSYILDGKAKTLEDFIKVCISAFEYDRSINMETALEPKALESDSYYREASEEASKALTAFSNLSYKERMDLYNQEVRENIERNEKYIKEKIEFNKKLTRMIQDIDNWKVPPDLKPLKDFMKGQCQTCIDTDYTWNQKEIDDWIYLKYGKWVENKFNALMAACDRAEEELDKEMSRIKKYNRWISMVKRYMPKKTLDIPENV